MNFGIWELLVILLIVALLFGTKKLRTIGGDLGSAIKGFRGALKEEDKEPVSQSENKDSSVIEGEVENENSSSNKV